MKSERQLLAMRKAITVQHGASHASPELRDQGPAGQQQAAAAC